MKNYLLLIGLVVLFINCLFTTQTSGIKKTVEKEPAAMPKTENALIPGNDKGLKSLAEVYSDYFTIGTCVELDQLIGKDGEVLLKHFSSITAENVMKPLYMAPKKDTFFFDNADKLVNFAQSNGLLVRGHTLVWHSQDAKWMYYDDNGEEVSKEVLFERMENHIKTIVSRYKGKVYAWDVVNEAFDNNRFRESKWYEICGEEYIEKAFQYAREADPDAKLFINDYGTANTQKCNTIYEKVKAMKEKGIPIDGVGLQFHITLTYPGLSSIKKSLDKYSSLGVEIHITELDMSINSDKNMKEENLNKDLLIRQAHRYKDLFNLFKQYKSITNVTLWGFNDGRSWLTYHPVKKPDWPLIFDKDLNIKLAYWGLVDPSRLPPDVDIRSDNNNKTAVAKPGTPKIDGIQENIWDIAEEIPVNTFILGNGSSAVGKALWDNSNLYIFMKVTDNKLSKASKDAYQQDCVEIFIDELNNKSYDYMDDDVQYRLNFDNELTVKGKPAETASMASITDDGYNIEVMIPIRFIKPESGVKIGFDLQVNDDSGVGSRTSIAKWNDKTNDSYRNTSGFGTLTLSE
ncbi:MAG: endo-1,4-beta-xylanase [Chitinispirillia bacterium]|jgi:endo-1,4-beta-xylanase